MASQLTWQNATDYAALAAAHRVEGDLASAGGPALVDVEILVGFTKARAEADLRTTAVIQAIIADLDQARAEGTLYTYGMIQDRLRALLDGPAPEPEAAGS